MRTQGLKGVNGVNHHLIANLEPLLLHSYILIQDLDGLVGEEGKRIAALDNQNLNPKSHWLTVEAGDAAGTEYAEVV